VTLPSPGQRLGKVPVGAAVFTSHEMGKEEVPRAILPGQMLAQ
jgi:hypothetical protein